MSKNFLQMPGGIIVLTDQRSSTTKESVGTSGDDNTFSFTLFARGTPECERKQVMREISLETADSGQMETYEKHWSLVFLD